MKSAHLYYLVIDNEKHMVEKDFFDSVNEGDEIKMYYAPYSEIILGLELSEN